MTEEVRGLDQDCIPRAWWELRSNSLIPFLPLYLWRDLIKSPWKLTWTFMIQGKMTNDYREIEIIF